MILTSIIFSPHTHVDRYINIQNKMIMLIHYLSYEIRDHDYYDTDIFSFQHYYIMFSQKCPTSAHVTVASKMQLHDSHVLRSIIKKPH